MGEDVHGEGGHAYVSFSAGHALFGRVRVEATVGLFVARQVAGGGVLLAALATDVPAGFGGAVGVGLGDVGGEGVDFVVFCYYEEFLEKKKDKLLV